MSQSSCLTVFLAAGQGTRMKSTLPKVMHQLAGMPMLAHVMSTSKAAGGGGRAVIIAPAIENVRKMVEQTAPEAEIFYQTEQLGTAHAVLAARPALKAHQGDVLVLYGDTPLLTPETVQKIRQTVGQGADLAVLGFEAADPTGYGRLICDHQGHLCAIREEKDATADERALRFCNSGVFCFRHGLLPDLLDKIGNDNAKGEYYLTDAVELASAQGLIVQTVSCPEEEVLGVNSRAQLAEAEAILQTRLRTAHMGAGVTFIAPETVFLCADTRIGEDCIIEPHVVFGPGVTLEERVRVKSFSHMEGAHLSCGSVIGPYARLRPGTELGKNAKVGNFVEIKKTRIEESAKVNHLSYIGDAHVGAKANIGAGTITCNYDGFSKHLTDIGAGTFIGSNSALVAPVKIGDGAYIGSGSVITKDVPKDALALTRSGQTERPEWAAKFRALSRHKKDQSEDR